MKNLWDTILIATMANAWSFTLYSESECETSPVASYSSTDDEACKELVTSNRVAFEVDDMGNCQLALYTDNVCSATSLGNTYTNLVENTCTTPMYSWNSFDFLFC